MTNNDPPPNAAPLGADAPNSGDGGEIKSGHRPVTSPAPSELSVEASGAEREDAARWRALLGCARVWVHGWTGLDMEGNRKPGEDYVHFSAGFWTHHAGKTDEFAARVLTNFADAAIAALRGVGTTSEDGGGA